MTSFRALVAPFLVDSRELERRVLESPLVERMLEGVEPLGLVGLAVLPGVLRRPFGLSRPLVSPQDYAGATFGSRYGGVARDSIAALGATAKAYRIGSLAGLDGAELDVSTIASNGYDVPGATLTANVVLWDRPETIVISRDAFDRLPPAQREILRRAGREALAPVLARIDKEQTQALELVCGRGNLTLATASTSELADLQVAVQPVYAELERDVQTREFIAEIRRLRSGIQAESAAVRRLGARRLEARGRLGSGRDARGHGGKWSLSRGGRDVPRPGNPRARRGTLGLPRRSSDRHWHLRRAGRHSSLDHAPLHGKPVHSRSAHRLRLERLPRRADAHSAFGAGGLVEARRQAESASRLRVDPDGSPAKAGGRPDVSRARPP